MQALCLAGLFRMSYTAPSTVLMWHFRTHTALRISLYKSTLTPSIIDQKISDRPVYLKFNFIIAFSRSVLDLKESLNFVE